MEYMGTIAPDSDFAIPPDSDFAIPHDGFSNTFSGNIGILNGILSCYDTTEHVIPENPSTLATTATRSVPSSVTTRSNGNGSRIAAKTVIHAEGPKTEEVGVRKGSRKKQKATRRVMVYTCSFCPKTWPSAYAVERHENSHTGNKPFACEICPKRFSQEANLKVHFEAVHNQVKHWCPVCFETLSSAANLNHHLSKTHAEYLGVHCERCDTWMRGDLARHQTTAVCSKKKAVIQKNEIVHLNSMLASIEEDEVANALCGY
ncbi:hypothetical protein T484DRAFT_1756113 [Baffinella frigidus]|nr:hypothetical protein T484DRAFT_1756113 [Cryptophyta sp. CCMP2293]